MGSPTRKPTQSNSRLTADAYADGILKHDRIILSRAITLAESRLKSDQLLAEALIQKILAHTGKSIRIGITGIPGVGKSTFIEAFGKHLTAIGKKLAVLAIDPSSQRTKGSILGDKTRMDELARDENAFIRPTSAASALGGVADKTRETILLCEAAGFDVIIVETVGVGQSEISVRNMVDFFLLLLLGGAGDELQGIKKGIMEMADGVVITKADGDNKKRAKQAQADYQHALHFFPPSDSGWIPKVLISSAIEHRGMNEVWQMVDDFKTFTKAKGFFEHQRTEQNIEWFHSSIEQLLKREIMQSDSLRKKMETYERSVVNKSMTPGSASRKLVEDFFSSLPKH
ncbi:MAG TPA: methylmalonyl Co-A mutase-associated GTPase MeaB [Cytophagales bacterium]|nr:methylmalonyl Co-A mutase-associated GTPase MeaB [Cytophagales bacterium]HCR55333.1 methylmalonyl Co-A mutase-associated GTPase MeaB [Cytophagales bacterium]